MRRKYHMPVITEGPMVKLEDGTTCVLCGSKTGARVIQVPGGRVNYQCRTCRSMLYFNSVRAVNGFQRMRALVLPYADALRVAGESEPNQMLPKFVPANGKQRK